MAKRSNAMVQTKHNQRSGSRLRPSRARGGERRHRDGRSRSILIFFSVCCRRKRRRAFDAVQTLAGCSHSVACPRRPPSGSSVRRQILEEAQAAFLGHGPRTGRCRRAVRGFSWLSISALAGDLGGTGSSSWVITAARAARRSPRHLDVHVNRVVKGFRERGSPRSGSAW